jgi:hypothetical protein
MNVCHPTTRHHIVSQLNAMYDTVYAHSIVIPIIHKTVNE